MLTEAAALRVALRAILFLFAFLGLIWVVVQLRDLVVEVLLAVIFAAAMTPLVDWVTESRPARRSRLLASRALVVILLYAALFTLVGAVAAAALPPLLGDVEDLARHAPDYARQIQPWLTLQASERSWLPPDLSDTLVAQLQGAAGQVAGLAGQAVAVVRVAAGVISGTLDAFFSLILALYITADNRRILNYLLGFLPADRQTQARAVGARIGLRLGGWVRGQLLLSTIIGLLTLIGLSIIGVRYAVLLALVAAIGEAIPLVGPIFSAIPAVIIAFTQSPAQGFMTIALYVLVQQVENNLIVPRVMGRAVELHPIAVILALLAGAELMGIIGAILAVPVTAALSVIVDEIRRAKMERERGALPAETPLA